MYLFYFNIERGSFCTYYPIMTFSQVSIAYECFSLLGTIPDHFQHCIVHYHNAATIAVEHLESFQIPTVINNAEINIFVIQSLHTSMIRPWFKKEKKKKTHSASVASKMSNMEEAERKCACTIKRRESPATTWKGSYLVCVWDRPLILGDTK